MNSSSGVATIYASMRERGERTKASQWPVLRRIAAGLALAECDMRGCEDGESAMI